MQTFVKSFVVVILVLGIGCAQNNGGGGPDFCTSSPLSPSCSSSSNPPVSDGQHLTVPTEFVRFQNETDPNIPFPTEVQIVELNPPAGSMVTAPFRFAWTFKARMDQVPNQYEGTYLQFFPSNDGETPSGPSFTNDGVGSGSEVTFQIKDGGTLTMSSTFKYILVRADWVKSGVGHMHSTLSFQVDLGK